MEKPSVPVWDGDVALSPPEGYPNGYPYGFDVMLVSDADLNAIHAWLLNHIGPRDQGWVYEFSFMHKYAAVWIKETCHATEFKLRWL
jgi:carboxylesterase type B